MVQSHLWKDDAWRKRFIGVVPTADYSEVSHYSTFTVAVFVSPSTSVIYVCTIVIGKAVICGTYNILPHIFSTWCSVG